MEEGFVDERNPTALEAVNKLGDDVIDLPAIHHRLGVPPRHGESLGRFHRLSVLRHVVLHDGKGHSVGGGDLHLVVGNFFLELIDHGIIKSKINVRGLTQLREFKNGVGLTTSGQRIDVHIGEWMLDVEVDDFLLILR